LLIPKTKDLPSGDQDASVRLETAIITAKNFTKGLKKDFAALEAKKRQPNIIKTDFARDPMPPERVSSFTDKEGQFYEIWEVSYRASQFEGR
jgi:hypothetical protein